MTRNGSAAFHGGELRWHAQSPPLPDTINAAVEGGLALFCSAMNELLKS
jgi:hypothetical protein